jgi:hypothetical protein
MGRGDPRPGPYEHWKGAEIKSQVMDFHHNNGNDEVPLKNHCCTSSTRKTRLEPEASAPYACRWMYTPLYQAFLSIATTDDTESGHQTPN